MARGVFSGILAGAVVAGLGLAGLSLAFRDAGPVGAVPPAPAPEAVSAAPEATSGTTAEEAAPEPTMGEGAAASPAVPPEMPPAEAAAGETPPAPPPGATMPAAETELTADAGGLPGGPASADAPPRASAESPAPQMVAPGNGPDRPAPETAPAADTGPANPEVQPEIAAITPAPAAGTGSAAQLPAGDHPANRPASPPQVSPEPGETPPPAASAPAAPPAGGQGVKTLRVGAGSSAPGTPAGQLGDLAENVVTGRLPAIGQQAASAPETASATPAAPAILRNAADFANPDNRPVMAVLLQDMGPGRRDLGDLKNIPFPLSFAVDASAPDAAEAERFYRDAGAEVVVIVPLLRRATPGDVETALQVYGPLLRDAVAVMVPKEAGFQTMGEGAAQLAAVLAQSGHGLIALPQGLNTGTKLALKQGVPAGLIFRELDNDGQSGAVIRRFMDNAAFKARQNKGVIVFGHARPETIQALIEWSLGNRAKSVALAPVSVVLQQK